MTDEAAEVEAPPLPMVTIEITVSDGKNLKALVPLPEPEEGAEGPPEGWLPKAMVTVAPPEADAASSEAVEFAEEDCAFGFTTSFERNLDESLFNFLVNNPMKLTLQDGGEVAEGAERAALGSVVVNFDAICDGETEFSDWYHIDPASEPASPLAAHPEVKITIKVSEALQTPLAAQSCTIMSLEVDQAFKLPEDCKITDVEGEPSPADAFRFGVKLTLPTTAEATADLLSIAGGVKRAASYVPPPEPVEGEEAPAEGEEAAAPEEPAVELDPEDEANMQTISWGMSERAYLTEAACEQVKAMIESGEGLKLRIWRNTVDAGGEVANCEPDWSDVSQPVEATGEVNVNVAEVVLTCTELLNSGASVVEGKLLLAAPPIPEPEEGAEAAEVAPNPYVEAGTYVSFRIVLSRPIVPELPAPPPLPKPADIVPPRPRVPKVIAPSSGTEEFKGEVDGLLNQLLDEYGAVASSKGTASATELRQQFLFELNSSGKYFTFKEKLKKSVVRIVKERFHKTPSGTQAELETMVNELYVYLVQQMHVCLNQRFSAAALGTDTADMGAAAEKLPLEKLYLFAAECEANQQYNLATAYMQDIVCADDSSIEGWNAFAAFSFRMRNIPKGCECLREAVSIDPSHIPTLLAYAAVQLHLGDLDAAQAFLHGAAELDSGNSMTWVLLGVLYHMLDRPIDAKSCNLEAKRLGLPEGSASPHQAAWKYLLGYQLTGVAAKAIAEEQAAFGSSFATFCALGEMNFLDDDFEAAEESLKEALALEGDSFAAWTLRGNAFFAQGSAGADSAVSAYETAVKDCTATSTEARCTVLMKLGELCVAQAGFERAREVYYEVCQSLPTASAWLGLGLSYVGLDDLDSAEECFSEANITNNQNPLVWGHLTLLALRTGRESEATLAYKEALKLGLSDVPLLRSIGEAQVALGKYTLAEGTLRRCAAYAEGDGRTQRLLGEVMYAQKAFEEALICYDAALAAGVDAEEDVRDIKEQCIASLEALGRGDDQGLYAIEN